MMTIDRLASLIPDSSGVTPTAVKSFEVEHEVKLPVDYKTFLELKNGGDFESESSLEMVFDSPLYQGGEGNVGFDRAYAIGGTAYEAVIPLSKWLTDTEREVTSVPDKIFVIGEDIMGNQITIDLRDGSYGQVALVDHEMVGDDFYDEETYQIVAESFAEFVSKLTP